MRFLFVHPSLSSMGGAQLVLQWLLNGLVCRGNEVALCCTEDPLGLAPQLSNNKISVRVGPPDLVLEEAERADVVVSGNYPATLWMGQAKLKSKKFPPVIWNCNEPPRILYEDEMSVHFLRSSIDPKFYLPWTLYLRKKKMKPSVDLEQAVVSQFDLIVSISHQTATWVKQIYKRDSVVIPLGVGDMVPLKPHHSQEVFTFLSPAGLEPIKNFKTILKAFGLLCQDRSLEVRLIMTGDGPWRNTAEKLATRFQVSDRIDFLGWISRGKLFDLYSKCHSVIYVPLDEPFGLVSCESGLAGKSIIASDHGGPAEVVRNGETGLLVNSLDPQALATAMKRLMADRPFAEQMGRAAQKRILSEFGFERHVESFESIAKTGVCGDLPN